MTEIVPNPLNNVVGLDGRPLSELTEAEIEAIPVEITPGGQGPVARADRGGSAVLGTSYKRTVAQGSA